ncbi:MAG: phage integrase SAM-like domain-containing protein [Dysgonomonas sp.]
MTTLKFIFRPSVRQGDHRGRLCLRIIHKRQSRQLSLPLQLDRKDWNRYSQSSYSHAINREMALIRKSIRQIILSLSLQGEYTAQDVLLRYKTCVAGNSLLGFVGQLSASYARRGQERTARAYLSAVRRLTRFCNNKQLPLSRITASLMEDFEQSLLLEGLSRNTISFYMRNLRVIYNKAVQMQQVAEQSQHPFANVYTGIETTRKRALSRSDINHIHDLDLSGKPALDFARRLFFFCFHARGMSFVDMVHLRKSDLRDGILFYRRQKTRQQIEVKLTGELKELIEGFAPQTRNSPYLLPIITRQEHNHRRQYESALRLQNKRLSVLGKKAGLNHPLTTHVARHSWASLAKEINTPLAVISESLGHSNQKTTYTYLSSFDRSILDKVGEEVSRLIQPIHTVYRYSTIS